MCRKLGALSRGEEQRRTELLQSESSYERQRADERSRWPAVLVNASGKVCTGNEHLVTVRFFGSTEVYTTDIKDAKMLLPDLSSYANPCSFMSISDRELFVAAMEECINYLLRNVQTDFAELTNSVDFADSDGTGQLQEAAASAPSEKCAAMVHYAGLFVKTHNQTADTWDCACMG